MVPAQRQRFALAQSALLTDFLGDLVSSRVVAALAAALREVSDE